MIEARLVSTFPGVQIMTVAVSGHPLTREYLQHLIEEMMGTPIQVLSFPQVFAGQPGLTREACAMLREGRTVCQVRCREV